MKIGLVEAIDSLREELRKAKDNSAEDIKFNVNEIEITFDLAVEISGKVGTEAGGRIKWWLFDANAKAQAEAGVSHTNTHSITLKLSPTDITSGDASSYQINDTVKSPRSSS